MSSVKENRKKWVAALRSGEFKQGKNFLENLDGSMCCLGVLCNIMGSERTVRTNKAACNTEGLEILYGDKFNMADKHAVEAVGLTNEAGDFTYEAKEKLKLPYASLWQLNDHANLTFKEIADIIESEPEGLFV